MAVSTPTSLLVNGSGTDTTAYTTASISPSANALLLLFVSCGHATASTSPSSFTGTLGLTWTSIVTNTQAGDDTLRGHWYWAVTTGSPPTGTITINFGSTHSSCQWHITQILGADLTTPIVQFDTGNATSTDNPGVTLSAIGTGNATLGACVWNTTTGVPAGSAYTSLSDSPSATSPTILSTVEYKVAGQTLVDWTLTSNVVKCYFGIEVADDPNRVGTGAGTFTFTGTAAGTTVMSGTGAGTMAYTGVAAGSRASNGTGAGTMAYTGTAAGTAAYQGTGAGTMAFTGTAAGTTTRTGTGAGTYTFTGTAAGVAPPNSGSAAGTYTFTGSAAGSRTSSGTGAGTMAFTGTAAGTKTCTGTGAGTFAYTGVAAGSRTSSGTGAGTFAYTGVASGTKICSGLGTGTYTFTGAAAGIAPPNQGSAGGTWLFTGAAAGARSSTGVGTGTWTFSGLALGTHVPLRDIEFSFSDPYGYLLTLSGLRANEIQVYEPTGHRLQARS